MPPQSPELAAALADAAARLKDTTPPEEGESMVVGLHDARRHLTVARDCLDDLRSGVIELFPLGDQELPPAA